MRKQYYIPTIEIIRVETERMMDMADVSGKAHMPARQDSNAVF